ncbi:2-oxoglutarate (2OG) and Fe(II)-dependent oxygenase superfamily protein [Euphorbia peplus]|nr:2-oxoglutarate (2OG) and Fe(II)-dependent oxygenase superfamily protein [Euphorbia peplus]
MATQISPALLSDQGFDRVKEAKLFDESKIGVKGLLDSGVTAVPRIFIHPRETLSDLKSVELDVIPTVDLSGERAGVVEQIARASRELGFFQIVNHGVEKEVMERIIGRVKEFHELPTEMKKQWYRRDPGPGVSFFSNVDLFNSKAASWRDTLQVRLGPVGAKEEDLPEVCRKEVVEWNKEATRVAELLMELLSEGLGLKPQTLKDMSCSEAKVMVGHYYPYCPQPDMTVGITSHTDPGVLTVLLQDQVGGLQVKHGHQWVAVKPVPGALVINIGDILQIMSNGEYTSVDHRVLANPSVDPRISVAIFFNPDYMTRFFSKQLDGRTLTNYYKL